MLLTTAFGHGPFWAEFESLENLCYYFDMIYKNIAKETFILVSFALITAFTVNFISPQGVALFGNWDTSRGVISAKSKNDIVVHELEIEDVETAKQIYDRGNVVFVDARSREMFEQGHIKGALSLPVNRFDTHIDKFKKTYPPASFIVTYCSGRECDDSHKLAQLFFAQGYTNISVFIDGYPTWKAAGYPVEK